VTRWLPILLLAPLFAAVAAQGQPTRAEGSTLQNPALPDGDGRTTFLRVCSSCHAPEIVTHQRLNHAGWEDLVYMMADQGAVATDGELDQIIEYLSRSFPDEGNPSA